MAKEQDRFSEGHENPRVVASPKGKTFHWYGILYQTNHIKTMMTLNNRNMYISILEINGESIITTLNKWPDMSDNRHLKGRYMQIMITLLKVKYGPKTTSILRNNEHIGRETSTMRRCFYHSLSKQLIHFLLNNGMMSCSCLHINQLEITEKRRAWPTLKVVSLNHIKHKPTGSIAFLKV